MDIKIKIPKDVKFVLDTLITNDFEAYIVGGCVRDSILGKEPKDWDITTDALPLHVCNLFRDLGYKVIETGLQHGTVTVIINGVGFEITTYRIDGCYDDNRHPKNVKFTNNLKEDLSRRDFTMNAMAYNDKIGIVDIFGGINDINNKTINCVGKTHDRFNEDALRMLRAIRFSAQLNFKLSTDIKTSCYELNANLKNISIERIREEFNKTLISDSNKFSLMCKLGLAKYWIPEIGETFIQQNNPYHTYSLFEHSLKSMEVIDNKIHLKLVMLLHDLGKIKTKTIDNIGISHYYGHPKESVKMTETILKRMKYDNNTINKILTLIQYHDCTLSSKKSIKKMLNKIGEDLLRDLIKVQCADILAQNLVYAKPRLTKLFYAEQILNEIIKSKECFSMKDLAINGNDLISLGFEQGENIGVLLKTLLEIVIEDNSLNSKEKLIEILKSRYIKHLNS